MKADRERAIRVELRVYESGLGLTERRKAGATGINTPPTAAKHHNNKLKQ